MSAIRKQLFNRTCQTKNNNEIAMLKCFVSIVPHSFRVTDGQQRREIKALFILMLASIKQMEITLISITLCNKVENKAFINQYQEIYTQNIQ